MSRALRLCCLRRRICGYYFHERGNRGTHPEMLANGSLVARWSQRTPRLFMMTQAGRLLGRAAAIDEGVPVPVLTTALYARFASRGAAHFQGKLLSAMRYGFGGHLEKPAK